MVDLLTYVYGLQAFKQRHLPHEITKVAYKQCMQRTDPLQLLPWHAGLLQGLPDGSEEDQLYQFEEEMERNSVMLRQYKSSNDQVQLLVVKPGRSFCICLLACSADICICMCPSWQLQLIHVAQCCLCNKRCSPTPGQMMMFIL